MHAQSKLKVKQEQRPLVKSFTLHFLFVFFSPSLCSCILSTKSTDHWMHVCEKNKKKKKNSWLVTFLCACFSSSAIEMCTFSTVSLGTLDVFNWCHWFNLSNFLTFTLTYVKVMHTTINQKESVSRVLNSVNVNTCKNAISDFKSICIVQTRKILVESETVKHISLSKYVSFSLTLCVFAESTLFTDTTITKYQKLLTFLTNGRGWTRTRSVEDRNQTQLRDTCSGSMETNNPQERGRPVRDACLSI